MTTRTVDGTVVLMYHSVASRDHDSFEIRVTPARFADQLEHLARAFDIVPLDAAREHGGPRVAITFDDGYADNAETAAPALARLGVPPTFFVTTDILGSRYEFWWDALERMLLSTPPVVDVLTVRIAGRVLKADIRSPEARSRVLTALQVRVHTLDPAVIPAVVSEVAEHFGSESRWPQARCMTGDQVRDLAAAGFEIGAHTRRHACLSEVRARDARAEIGESRALLEGVLDQPVRAFAYPFGAFGTATPRWVKRAGFESACTTVPEVATPRTDPFHIPRVAVPDCDGTELVNRVQMTFEDWACR